MLYEVIHSSLHDALPIFSVSCLYNLSFPLCCFFFSLVYRGSPKPVPRKRGLFLANRRKSQQNVFAIRIPNEGSEVNEEENEAIRKASHGAPVSFSAQMYHFTHYPLGSDGHLDYEVIAQCLDRDNPNLFLAGYSAYPYAIDFKRMREEIDKHNAHSAIHCFFMVDMAHIAGIIAAGLCQNPCDYADLVTSTTHKTLRGPRGGIILTNGEELAKKVNKAIFPYTQGGPLEHERTGPLPKRRGLFFGISKMGWPSPRFSRKGRTEQGNDARVAL